MHTMIEGIEPTAKLKEVDFSWLGDTYPRSRYLAGCKISLQRHAAVLIAMFIACPSGFPNQNQFILLFLELHRRFDILSTKDPRYKDWTADQLATLAADNWRSMLKHSTEILVPGIDNSSSELDRVAAHMGKKRTNVATPDLPAVVDAVAETDKQEEYPDFSEFGTVSVVHAEVMAGGGTGAFVMYDAVMDDDVMITGHRCVCPECMAKLPSVNVSGDEEEASDSENSITSRIAKKSDHVTAAKGKDKGQRAEALKKKKL